MKLRKFVKPLLFGTIVAALALRMGVPQETRVIAPFSDFKDNRFFDSSLRGIVEIERHGDFAISVSYRPTTPWYVYLWALAAGAFVAVPICLEDRRDERDRLDARRIMESDEYASFIAENPDRKYYYLEDVPNEFRKWLVERELPNKVVAATAIRSTGKSESTPPPHL